LPWGHNRELLDKLETSELREWYARSAIEFGWSRPVLMNQIMSKLHIRAGAAPSNFRELLPDGESELVQQLTKDPYNLEFLTLAGDVAERDLERALVSQIERFLLELGAGFAFVGRQWRLDLDGDEFFIDLLMFHIPQNRYVVIELKTGKLTPGDVGQLNFYVARGRWRSAPRPSRTNRRTAAVRRPQRTNRAIRTVPFDLADGGRRYRYNELPPAEQAVLPGEDALIELVADTIARLDHNDA
jgi:predicted nuclease of restriction endonuclease-like (RecB) superfamily